MEWVKMRDAINRSPMNNFFNFIKTLYNKFVTYILTFYKI